MYIKFGEAENTYHQHKIVGHLRVQNHSEGSENHCQTGSKHISSSENQYETGNNRSHVAYGVGFCKVSGGDNYEEIR